MITKLKFHHEFRRYFANTSWLFLERILRIFVGLFVGIWVARYLGPEQFGLLSYAVSFVGLFAVIATLELNEIIVRELVKDESQRDILLGTAFILKLIGAILVLIILAIAVNFTNNDFYTNLLVFIIASSTIFQSFNVLDVYFQSKVLSRYVVFANIISLFISSVIKIGLILCGAPLIAFAIVILFDSFILASGFLYFYYRQKLEIKAWKFDFQKAKDLLKDSWPIILSGLAITIQARIDQVMLKEMIGDNEVGQYSVAMRLIETFAFIPMVIRSSILPLITAAKKISEELYYKRLLDIYRVMMLSFILVALPIYLFSENIVLFLYGYEYQAAGVLLGLFAIRLFFINYGVAKGMFIINNNLFRYLLFLSIIGVFINIILNKIWIPEYRSVGAIWATIISFSVTDFFIDLFYRKSRKNLYFMFISIFTFYKINIVLKK